MTLRPQPGTFHPLSTNANDFYPPSPPPPINRFEMIYRYTKIVIQFSFFICKIRDSANDNGKLYSKINWKKKNGIEIKIANEEFETRAKFCARVTYQIMHLHRLPMGSTC